MDHEPPPCRHCRFRTAALAIALAAAAVIATRRPVVTQFVERLVVKRVPVFSPSERKFARDALAAPNAALTAQMLIAKPLREFALAPLSPLDVDQRDLESAGPSSGPSAPHGNPGPQRMKSKTTHKSRGFKTPSGTSSETKSEEIKIKGNRAIPEGASARRDRFAPSAGAMEHPASRTRARLDAPDWDGRMMKNPGSLVSAVRTLRGALGRSSAGQPFGAAGAPQGKNGARKLRGARASLADLIGFGALRPPLGRPAPPDFSALAGTEPKTGPDGRPIEPKAALPKELERLAAPDTYPEYAGWNAAGHPRSGHWHKGSDAAFYHQGRNWGALQDSRWTWLMAEQGRWWALGAGKHPVLRHGEHWWWGVEKTWYLLREGRLLAYRWFKDWKAEGLIDPDSKARIIYSADGTKAAVAAPGEDTVLFNLITGRELGRWPPE